MRRDRAAWGRIVRTLDIRLAGSRSVGEVVLIGNPGTIDDAAPSETSTWASSSQFDTSTYTVQAWSGSAWQTVASTSGNTKHIVRLAFAPVTTDRIRVIPVDDASNGQSANDNLVSLTEIEVRTPAGAGEIRTQRFDAWGRLEQAAGSVPTYGFTGREPDATGLIHYRARYYHPELGRFVSRDPLGLSAGINPYAYADGNPVLFNDPDGLLARQGWNTTSNYVKGLATSLNLKLGEVDPGSPPVSYRDFVKNIEGKSLEQVQNEAGAPGFSVGFYKSGVAGPSERYRYVRDTGNPEAVIDMRHFLVVGERGSLYGLGIEILQKINGFDDSAFKTQGFFSNALGVEFFKTYNPSKPLAPQIEMFFEGRK